MRLAIVLILVSCGGSNRDACYASNEDAAARRAEKECFDRGEAWDTCESRPKILEDLSAAHRRCE